MACEASMLPGANYGACRDTLLAIHGNGVWRAVVGPISAWARQERRAAVGPLGVPHGLQLSCLRAVFATIAERGKG
eukprot:2073157-Lingulodinium_polyedra.AAC.1